MYIYINTQTHIHTQPGKHVSPIPTMCVGSPMPCRGWALAPSLISHHSQRASRSITTCLHFASLQEELGAKVKGGNVSSILWLFSRDTLFYFTHRASSKGNESSSSHASQEFSKPLFSITRCQYCHFYDTCLQWKQYRWYN